MRACVTMCALIHNKGTFRHNHLVNTQQEQYIQSTTLQHSGSIKSALARHKAQIERTNQCRFRVQHIEPIPAVFYDAQLTCRFRQH